MAGKSTVCHKAAASGSEVPNWQNTGGWKSHTVYVIGTVYISSIACAFCRHASPTYRLWALLATERGPQCTPGQTLHSFLVTISH